MNNRVFIKGKAFEIKNARNVVISGNNITIDGKEISSLTEIKGRRTNKAYVRFEGKIESEEDE